MDATPETLSVLRSDYRREIESSILGESIRNASLLFVVLQTIFFVPADWILHPSHFSQFLVARLVENVLLGVVYFWWSRRNAVHATAFTAFTGSGLFLYMVHLTGGVESGYYVGLILLLVGIAVLAPLSGKQSALMAAGISLSYASLPWTSHGAVNVNWSSYFQHLFFLGSAAIEAALACLLMDRMRFNDFCQKRELIRARDELAEMDRAKSRFSANVHHELRTPLTLILSPLDALRSREFGPISREVSETLDTMHSNGRRLHKMINNLLDLSKLESEQFKIIRRPTSIGKLVSELTSGAIPMAERKGVSLCMHPTDSEHEVAIDPDAIEKVIVNLIGNALKFTDRGGGIDVRCEINMDGVEVSVSDSGIGIPLDQLSSIFDRFAQVDTSATRSYEGTGIGLSLAQEMVQLHNGRIWAESDGVGHGTAMHFWLPNGMADASIEEDVLSIDDGSRLNTADSLVAIEADLNIGAADDDSDDFKDISRQVERTTETEQRHADSAEDRANGSDSRTEILITEDNPDMRKLLRTLISREYKVRTAVNGRDALEKVADRKPDLILSDVMMPEMDGTELCRRIKSDDNLRSIPVVLVTSKAESEMKIEGLEMGADDYVTKPFHPRELMARVGALVRASTLRRELAESNEHLSAALDDLQRAEALLIQNERLAAVGELAAGIAHEVNNPVNFALNAARALTRNMGEIGELRAPPEQTPEIPQGHQEELIADVLELSAIVTEGLERTSNLVTDLKSFASRDETATLRIETIDLEACIRSSVSLVEPTLAQHGVQVSITNEDMPVQGKADSSALGQVLLNLLKNSGDAMRETGGTIEIGAVRIGTEVRVTVSDNGPGMDESTRLRIFEPFFTTKQVGEGTGLGLAVSRRIVDGQGGTLSVESDQGAGTTMTITLPD